MIEATRMQNYNCGWWCKTDEHYRSFLRSLKSVGESQFYQCDCLRRIRECCEAIRESGKHLDAFRCRMCLRSCSDSHRDAHRNAEIAHANSGASTCWLYCKQNFLRLQCEMFSCLANFTLLWSSINRNNTLEKIYVELICGGKMMFSWALCCFIIIFKHQFCLLSLRRLSREAQSFTLSGVMKRTTIIIVRELKAP